MIKYIASDLDGTLLHNGAQQLPEEIFDLIRALKSRGIHFIAASGRQYYNMYRMFEPVQNDISYIAENGSLCIHNHEIISRGVIDRDLGLRIIEASRQYDSCNCLVSCEDHCYTDSKDEHFISHILNTIKYDMVVVDDLKQIQKPFLKIAMCDFHTPDKLLPFFKNQFRSEIKVVTSGNIWVDFIAPNANKGQALSNLLAHLHLSASDGIAFGDQYNDLEMLELAGTGYAMKNAAPGVSDNADKVTESAERIMREILKTQ